MATARDPDVVKRLVQQNFQLCCEIYKRLQDYRKELSIPGSVPGDGEVLFDKEDLSKAAMQQRINSKGFRSTTFHLSPLSPKTSLPFPQVSK